MFVIMGGTGHVGAAVAHTLRQMGADVGLITRDADRANTASDAGRKLIEADACDFESSRVAFRQGSRAFLLNPPAAPTTDTDKVERESVACILAALKGSGLEKVVAASTCGAQPGDRLGDLSVLWELEQGLLRQPIPAAINCGAYYMSNWDVQIGSARDTGCLQSMFPAELRMPMVAPQDLGRFGAERLLSGLDDIGTQHILGPRAYTPSEVAGHLEQLHGGHVVVKVAQRQDLAQAFSAIGFSDAAADTYARMTRVSIDQGLAVEGAIVRGSVTLEAYLDGRIRDNRSPTGTT